MRWKGTGVSLVHPPQLSWVNGAAPQKKEAGNYLETDFYSTLELPLGVPSIESGFIKPDLVLITARFEGTGRNEIHIVARRTYGFDSVSSENKLRSQVSARKGAGHTPRKHNTGP